MRLQHTKYLELLSWVDSQPANSKFSVKEASEATKIRLKTVASTIYYLRKVGFLTINGKTSQWNLKKALEANNNRLKVRYKKRVKQNCNLSKIFTCQEKVTFNIVDIDSTDDIELFYRRNPDIHFLNKRLTLQAGTYLFEFFSWCRKDFARLFVTPMSVQQNEELIFGKRITSRFSGR